MNHAGKRAIVLHAFYAGQARESGHAEDCRKITDERNWPTLFRANRTPCTCGLGGRFRVHLSDSGVECRYVVVDTGAGPAHGPQRVVVFMSDHGPDAFAKTIELNAAVSS